jgi:drug/metabolite transporter (DMT)-like permease
MNTPVQPSAYRAALWMSGALLSFTGMALAGRELSAEISLYQILFLRSVFCLTILVPLVWRFGWTSVRTDNGRLHLLRNSVHYLASYCWFLGVMSIPLAEVFAIEFTAPIWTAILAAIFLRERLTGVRVLAISLGFAGVLVILRPGLEIVHPASFSVLLAALGYGSVYVITRRLAGRDSPLTILFYMNLVQLVIGIGPTLYHWVTPSIELWPWAVLVGIVGLTSHYCIARAIVYADAAVVAPLDFLRLPLIAVVGYLFYQEPFDIFVIAGAALVVGGNVLNIRGERKVKVV